MEKANENKSMLSANENHMYDVPFNQLQDEGPFLVLNHRSASLPSNFLHIFSHKSLFFFFFMFSSMSYYDPLFCVSFH